MVYIPVRKCWHSLKVCFLLVLVLCLLSLFEQWRGGKRSANAEDTYEKQIREDEARIIPGLGEGGYPATLTGIDEEKGKESEKKLAMNVYLSDRIPYNRTLKDYRNPSCRRVIYDAELPSASVIIIFHNEPYSVVLRTIWTVLNSARRDQPWYRRANRIDRATGAKMELGYKGQPPDSPYVYLKEIILVDDNSTLPELKGKLSFYIKTRLPSDMIRILRLPERGGLTRARIAGSHVATGDVMVFLDSHCEPDRDWLRPLLQRIKRKRTAVLTPMIDMLDGKSFEYNTGTLDFEASKYWRATLRLQLLLYVQGYDVKVGGFTFNGHFTWIDVPEREKKRRGSNISPTWSPTMAGGLFAMNREYYWELGGYDEMMGGWGGENLEMSFRVWQCGGTLETIPCSRVGHVFRAFHPYGLPGSSDTHGINTARMAEVWMDEYAELFYLHRPDLRKNPKIGDVTHRKVLREKLHCKSFQWYLDNIYPEKFVPIRDVYAYGRFKNKFHNICLDTLQREASGSALGLYPCHARLVPTQYFSLSLAGQLREEEKCAEVAYDGADTEGRPVWMQPCRDPHTISNRQQWSYNNGVIQQKSSKLCLTARAGAESDVLVKTCDGSPDQIWTIDYSQENDFKRDSEYEESESLERQARLRKLRGHRRISRSLLSVDEARVEEPRAANNSSRRRSRRKKHKKRSHHRKNKNKFILRIERTVPPANGQRGDAQPVTEHLEVDVRCPHRKLLPNDTFVRDLVSVLNSHDIRVINNGRVFERNRVSQLPHVEKKEMVKPVGPPGEHHLLRNLPEPPHPALRQQRHRKRPAPPPAPPAPPSPHSPPAIPPVMGSPPRPKHKIIVEDFVEMGTGDPNAKKKPDGNEWHKIYPGKRYRLRKRNKSTKPRRAPNAHNATHAPSTAPTVPQSARDALLALLGDKIDKATKGEGKASPREYEPAGPARPALPTISWQDAAASVEEVPIPLAVASVETWNAGKNNAQNDSLRREIPVSSSDERTQKQAQSLVKLYHSHDTTSQELDNEVKQFHSEKKSQTTQATSDEIEKKAVATSDEGEPAPEPDEQAGEQAGEDQPRPVKPVKVTMRNNFTFNIGDEFFSWRTNNDDVADILGELAIPTNSSDGSPPIEAWVRPAAHTTPALRKGDKRESSSSVEGTNLKVLTGGNVINNEDSSASGSSGDK